jgi:hypothetical protein
MTATRVAIVAATIENFKRNRVSVLIGALSRLKAVD